MATEHLLEGFPPVSTAAWEAAIARDLKGADYEKKLIWRSDEGLAVKPYYRAEDLKELAFLNAAPGEFPYRRGARATGDWQIREEIDASNAEGRIEQRSRRSRQAPRELRSAAFWSGAAANSVRCWQTWTKSRCTLSAAMSG